MVRNKKAKTFSLILAAVLLLLAVAVPGNSVAWQLGLCPGGSLLGRLVYPFLHANFLHALVNSWAMLSLVFMYDLSLWSMLLAYVAAVSVPGCCVPGFTLGLSGFCFFLMGRCSFLVRRRLYYNCLAVAFMGLGFLFPNCAAWLHVYCYVLGFITGWLNSSAGD